MDAEVTLFSKPEELIAWADTFDILLNPSIEDAAILLNYMEGHDYAIGIDSDGKMYRQDVTEENGEIEPYPIDDVIEEYKRTAGAVLLDVRTPQEYQEGHIPESKNVPLQQLDNIASVAKNKDIPLFVYCYSGSRSRQATGILQRMGYSKVNNIGGIAAYSGKVEK